MKRLRIAVVDDESLVVSTLTRLVPEHDVAAFGGGRMVLDLVRAGELFDVIICDLMMPKMTGAELYREILAFAPDQARRIIFVTGGATTDDTREFVATMTLPILFKPFDPLHLRELIARFNSP